MRRFLVWGAVALLVALVFIAVIAQLASLGVSHGSAHEGTAGANLWFWFAALVLFVVAGAGFLGRGGAPARWALGLLVVLLGFKFLSGLIFGDQAPLVEKTLQKGAAKTVLEDRPKKPEEPKGAGSSSSAISRPQAAKQEAVWPGRKPGEPIPVGVWSEIVKLEQGCNISVTVTERFRAKGSFMGGKEFEFRNGPNPHFDQFQLMVMEEGIPSYPYQLFCS